MINYEITMHEIEGQKRQDCIIKAQIPNQTVVNVGEILIRLEFHQPGSYLNRSLKEFLEISCFKSTDLVILDLLMDSKDGDCRLSWNFDTSKELDVALRNNASVPGQTKILWQDPLIIRHLLDKNKLNTIIFPIWF